MKYLIILIIASIIAVIVFASVEWGKINLSPPNSALINMNTNEYQSEDTDEMEYESKLWIDTVLYSKGHAFGYSGDVSMWGGWYFDTICVGYDNMLQYDSLGPSTLKLSLVTREMIVNICHRDAIDKIKSFLNPISGFRRFTKHYDECLDSTYYEGYGYDKYMGGFSFEVDYPDNSNKNAEKINRFICELSGLSESENIKISHLSALYAGFNPIKYYRPVYSGNKNDMNCLSYFLAHKTFENWKRSGEFGIGSSESTLAIRPHIANDRYVTFSKYEYEREGIGHGMYTETFHTLDLENGRKLNNNDIFRSKFLNKVKVKLYEVMAKDPKFIKEHDDTFSTTEIENLILAYQSPSSFLEENEEEETKRENSVKLPEGALTEYGVVFSFQPYEIDCWAAGAYHFIVPYDKILPYMTNKAQKLICRH